MGWAKIARRHARLARMEKSAVAGVCARCPPRISPSAIARMVTLEDPAAPPAHALLGKSAAVMVNASRARVGLLHANVTRTTLARLVPRAAPKTRMEPFAMGMG